MALDGSLRALYAARLIGQMRSQDAVNQLLGSRSADNQVQFVTTLMEVRQAAGNLPLSVPLWLRWQVAVKSAAQEFLDDRPTLFRAYLASALAAALSLGFYVYSLYVLPRFLDAARILNAIGSGLLFGLVIGLGIFCARLIAHRLRTVAPLPRLIAATGLGGVIMTAGFSGYHVLFLDSSPTGGLISIASLVIALGFGVGALLAVPGLLRALISSLTIAAVTGLAWYLYLSTSVTPLLYFEPGQPVRMGFLIFVFSLCMGAIPHTVSLFKVRGNAGRT
jgi:hypothetical protein